MSRLDDFARAGYMPFPVAASGRPMFSGVLSGYRYVLGTGDRFADCDVGLACIASLLPGVVVVVDRNVMNSVTRSMGADAARVAAVTSTWIAAIRWTSHNAIIRREIDGLVSAVLGDGHAYIDGDTTTRLARVEYPPLTPRRIAPLHFSGEPWRSLAYQPHRFEVMCRGGWIALSRDAKPTPRAQLPLIDGDGGERLISSVESAFNKRGALPWL
jgi:hypothetical protein